RLRIEDQAATGRIECDRGILVQFRRGYQNPCIAAPAAPVLGDRQIDLDDAALVQVGTHGALRLAGCSGQLPALAPAIGIEIALEVNLAFPVAGLAERLVHPGSEGR